MMEDLFNEKGNQGQGTPTMLMGDGIGTPDFSQYRYRIQRFTLGSADEDDESSAMEALLTRSIQSDRNVVIVERKDSISATTGVYTCIIIYLERRQSEGATDA